mmetsp:Transcript_2136/g.6412  ORF Transcript_2136/g.6412 Transcript_2136/m.6412 type:complete len:212 (-) Transcript_2136:82-717(-)
MHNHHARALTVKKAGGARRHVSARLFRRCFWRFRRPWCVVAPVEQRTRASMCNGMPFACCAGRRRPPLLRGFELHRLRQCGYNGLRPRFGSTESPAQPVHQVEVLGRLLHLPGWRGATNVHECMHELVVIDAAVFLDVRLRKDFLDLGAVVLIAQHCAQVVQRNIAGVVDVEAFERLLDVTLRRDESALARCGKELAVIDPTVTCQIKLPE